MHCPNCAVAHLRFRNQWLPGPHSVVLPRLLGLVLVELLFGDIRGVLSARPQPVGGRVGRRRVLRLRRGASRCQPAALRPLLQPRIQSPRVLSLGTDWQRLLLGEEGGRGGGGGGGGGGGSRGGGGGEEKQEEEGRRRRKRRSPLGKQMPQQNHWWCLSDNTCPGS